MAQVDYRLKRTTAIEPSDKGAAQTCQMLLCCSLAHDVITVGSTRQKLTANMAVIISRKFLRFSYGFFVLPEVDICGIDLFIFFFGDKRKEKPNTEKNRRLILDQVSVFFSDPYMTLRLFSLSLLHFCIINLFVSSTLSLENGLGLVPPMGWNSW